MTTAQPTMRYRWFEAAGIPCVARKHPLYSSYVYIKAEFEKFVVVSGLPWAKADLSFEQKCIIADGLQEQAN
jgi:hypothetical protein